MEIYTKEGWINLNNRQVSIIDKCSDYDRNLVLIKGNVGYNPTKIYDSMPQFDECFCNPTNFAWYGASPPKGYGFWYSIHDEWIGDGISFYYPLNAMKEERIIVYADQKPIKWIHGLENLIKWKLQIPVWDWLLRTRGYECAYRREVKRLRKYLRLKSEISVETIAMF